jgi:hypothetical protein
MDHRLQASGLRGVPGILALMLAIAVMVGGPAAGAQAAGEADYGTMLQTDSWSVAPGETVYFTAFYTTRLENNGWVRVTLFLQRGFDKPTLLSFKGFDCSKRYLTYGWVPGWYIQCTKRTLTPDFGWPDMIKVKTTTSTLPGDYQVISDILSTDATDVNPADNRVERRMRVSPVEGVVSPAPAPSQLREVYSNPTPPPSQ